MRIFQVVTVSEYGGAQSVVANLVEALTPEDEVFILYGGDGEAWANLGNKVTRLRISGHRKKISWKDLILLFRLIYYRFKYKPDIVHLHSSKMGALGRIAFNPKKIAYTIHGVDSIRIAFRKFIFIEKLLKNRSAKVIGVSQYDVDGLAEEGICKDAILIYNGLIDYAKGPNVNLDLNISTQLEAVKAQYPKLILCISRISKQKKFELFIDIAKEMPNYAFVWIGNKEAIENLPSNVYCLGEVSFAHNYLKYADLFILPSNYEGLPVSILESLSYGVPVVASNVGGVKEILDGQNGFSVENNVQSFKEKIEYSLADDNAQRMSESARSSYLERFTVDKMIAGYKSVFEQIHRKTK